MKHILILGAGLMQEPAIDAAHELGFEVTVFDGNENSFCKNKCEYFETIDLKYTDKIVKRAEEIHAKNPFSAVFTAGTDFSVAVSSVAQACNLKAHTVDAALNASDKIVMRSCFTSYNAPSPTFVEVKKSTNFEDVLQFASEQTYPIVVKPCDNMGARGCRLARNKKELQESIQDAMKYSKTERVIVEKYMEGPEYSIDALVYNNEVTITGFADRHVYFPPYFIEMGHSMPTSCNNTDYAALVKTFVQGIRALGLSHGAAKADIKLTNNGPMIGEIAGRLSGGYMSGWTYPYASELNLTKQALQISLGDTPEDLFSGRKKIFDNIHGFDAIYDYPCINHSIERAWLSIPGCVSNISYGSESNIMDVLPRLNKGDNAVFPVNNVEKAGNIICVGSDRKKAEKIAKEFIGETLISIEKGDKTTIDFLCENLSTDFPPSAFNLPQSLYEKIESIDKNELPKIPLSLPSFLEEYKDELDWNGISLGETIHKINAHFDMQKQSFDFSLVNNALPNFWSCLIRGGIQGALFYLFDLCDTLN